MNDMKINNLLKNGLQRPTLSKFLTIEEQSNLVSKKYNIVFSNSYPEEERKRAFISSKDLDIIPDFNISFLKIISKEKLKHPDILGALMNIGITREVIGDIIINEEVYVIVCSEIKNYIKDNLLKVNKENVEVVFTDRLNFDQTDNYFSESIIVSSLRVDSILSKGIHLSREKAQELINMRYIKINGKICLNNDYICKENDIISITKFGRIIVRDITRKTKKDKLVLNIDRTK